MKKLRAGQELKRWNGEPLIADGKPITVRSVLIGLLEGHSEQDRDKEEIIYSLGEKLASCEDEWVELENAEFSILKRLVNEQAGTRYTVLISKPLRDAFDEAEEVYRKGNKKPKGEDDDKA